MKDFKEKLISDSLTALENAYNRIKSRNLADYSEQFIYCVLG